MDADVGAAEAQQEPLKLACLEDLLKFAHPLPPPRIYIRPWWFPVQELENPLVFYLEAWVADKIFGELLVRLQPEGLQQLSGLFPGCSGSVGGLSLPGPSLPSNLAPSDLTLTPLALPLLV